MDVYLWKIRSWAPANMTMTYMTVEHLTGKKQGQECNLYTDNPGHWLRRQRTIFLLCRHDNSKQIPRPICMWEQNDSSRLPIVPHAKPYCKGWESTLPTITAGQPVCFVQNQVMQLEVNFSSQWPLPILDCTAALFSAWRIKKTKRPSLRSVMWECASVSEIVMYQLAMAGLQSQTHLIKQIHNIYFSEFRTAHHQINNSDQHAKPFASTFYRPILGHLGW
jgi:hypothetical protein